MLQSPPWREFFISECLASLGVGGGRGVPGARREGRGRPLSSSENQTREFFSNNSARGRQSINPRDRGPVHWVGRHG